MLKLFRSYHRVASAAAGTAYYPSAVAHAYHYPANVTGKGWTCGIVELGGGYRQADLDTYFSALGVPSPAVTAVSVQGGGNSPSTADGADAEVMLDIEVAGAVAPGAEYRVYFAPNTDAGFLAAVEQATAECHVVSISWGQAESEWSPSSLQAFDAAFAAARAKGVTVFCAAGDSGADDSTSTPVTDFPASSPNVVGCGGTRLELDSNSARASEVAWDDNPTSSATGGGVSRVFPGRQVPDVAGNADPQTGYRVRVDGADYVIGGTSAVAPLMAGLTLLLLEATGGHVPDLLATIPANPGVCFDVTVGSNGAYRAGPGRDQVTGFGVVDGARLLAALGQPVTVQPTGHVVTFTPDEYDVLTAFAADPHGPHHYHRATVAAKAWDAATAS